MVGVDFSENIVMSIISLWFFFPLAAYILGIETLRTGRSRQGVSNTKGKAL